jgi:hypothetical protein
MWNGFGRTDLYSLHKYDGVFVFYNIYGYSSLLDVDKCVFLCCHLMRGVYTYHAEIFRQMESLFWVFWTTLSSCSLDWDLGLTNRELDHSVPSGFVGNAWSTSTPLWFGTGVMFVLLCCCVNRVRCVGKVSGVVYFRQVWNYSWDSAATALVVFQVLCMRLDSESDQSPQSCKSVTWRHNAVIYILAPKVQASTHGPDIAVMTGFHGLHQVSLAVAWVMKVDLNTASVRCIGRWGIAPRILDVGTMVMSVRPHAPAPLPPRKEPVRIG